MARAYVPLTLKQHQIYHYIRQHILKQGYSPTLQEIATRMNMRSRGTVYRNVKDIVKAGLLQSVSGKRRNLLLTDEAINPYGELPIIGRIAAGQPIEAVEDNKVLSLAEALFNPNRYVLEVKGDSMIGDNICDGDFILCERRDKAKDGEIAVVLVDNVNATLKRIKHLANNKLLLIPSNPTLKPMEYETARVKIQGVYLGLIRLA